MTSRPAPLSGNASETSGRAIVAMAMYFPTSLGVERRFARLVFPYKCFQPERQSVLEL
jgi:hypothetical protein